MKNPPPSDPVMHQQKLGSSVMSPVAKFIGAAVLGAFVLLGVSALLVDAGNLLPLGFGLLGYLGAVSFAAARLSTHYPHNTLGLCNLVTLARLVIVSIMFVVLITGTPPNWAIFFVAVLALCLDGIDGWLARMQGLTSDFGARFDVEVDAAFALVLAVYAATNGAAGAYVILLGIPHYLFWIAKTGLPWLNQPLPERFGRKIVCVFQIAALIALQVPFFANGALNLLTGAVALALIWSFGRDILWLWRARS